MATKAKSTSRTTLVNGCGTILKTNRLKHGYTLVKRKKVAGTSTATATATAKTRKTRKKTTTTPKAVTTITEKVVMTTPAKRKAGRPIGSGKKVVATTTITTPAKRKAGRPKGSKKRVIATAMKPSVKATPKRRGKRKSSRAVKA
jgi:tetrahydromethanopterin S-methyltransferase subunit H